MEETKGARAYRLVNEYLEKHPGTSASKACKELGVPVTTYLSYFKSREFLSKGPRKRRKKREPTLQTFTVPEVKEENIAVIWCPRGNLLDVLRELRG